MKIVEDNFILFAFGAVVWFLIFLKMGMIKTSIPGTTDIFSMFLNSKKISSKTRHLYNFLVICFCLLSPVVLLFAGYMMQKYIH